MLMEDLVPERLREAHRAGLARYAVSGSGPLIDAAHPVEVPALRRDGEEISIELTLNPLAGGRRVRGMFVLALIRDATARQRLEQERIGLLAAVQAREELFRTAFEQAAIGMSLVGLDSRYLQVNAALCALTGYTEAELLARTFRDITHPTTSRRTGRSSTGFSPARSHPSSARSATCARTAQSSGSGSTPRLSVTNTECRSPSSARLRDITARIEAEAALRRARDEAADADRRTEEQRDHLRTILDHLPAGVLILRDSNGQVEQANTTALQMIFGPGATQRELPVYGRDFRFLRGDGTPVTHEQRLGMRTLYGEMVGHEHLLLERRDGHTISVLAHAAPLPETTGEHARAVLVQQDVTRLREAEQLKDDFLALISHEFRTPLTTIHGGAHLLLKQRAALNEITQDELLTDIATESERLDHMLANILTLAAVMAGRLEVSTEPVLLAPLVREVVSLMARQVPHHPLHVAVPSGLPAVEGDPALLSEVLTNLYENAAKYSPLGSLIVTTASHDDGYIALDITDVGIGIPTDQLEHVFNRFYRVDHNSHVRGTGLGLYLSRALIEAQGGRLVARSHGLGTGSTFSITLPIVDNWCSTD